MDTLPSSQVNVDLAACEIEGGRVASCIARICAYVHFCPYRVQEWILHAYDVIPGLSK